MEFNIFIHKEGASPSTLRLVSMPDWIGIDPKDKDIFKVEFNTRDGRHVIRYQVEDKPYSSYVQKNLNERILRKDGATEMLEGVEPKYIVSKGAWYSVINEVINKILIDRGEVDAKLYDAEKQRRIKGEPRAQTSDSSSTDSEPKSNQRIAKSRKTTDAVNIPNVKVADKKSEGSTSKDAKF